MDFDRKKLKPMWAQFWASHQVSRPTPPQQLSNQTATSAAWLGFKPSSLASTPAAWLQPQQPGFNLQSLQTHSHLLQQLANQMAMPHSHPPSYAPTPSSSNLLASTSYLMRYVTLASTFTCVSLSSSASSNTSALLPRFLRPSN